MHVGMDKPHLVAVCCRAVPAFAEGLLELPPLQPPHAQSSISVVSAHSPRNTSAGAASGRSLCAAFLSPSAVQLPSRLRQPHSQQQPPGSSAAPQAQMAGPPQQARFQRLPPQVQQKVFSLQVRSGSAAARRRVLGRRSTPPPCVSASGQRVQPASRLLLKSITLLITQPTA